ncbi:MAG: PIN domain-containing protein [Lachnospiraceae bacterium]|nr:PIN domain-containing protein [Lachnospiraceae bacterium]
MLLVIDTNIIVNAIKSPVEPDEEGNRGYSKSQQLIHDVLSGKHTMVVSTPIIAEYEDVLHRPYLKLNPILVEKFLAIIKVKAIWIEPLPTTQHEVEMSDEDDRIFFDVAKCLKIKLVTRNLKHYPVHELRTSIDELY